MSAASDLRTAVLIALAQAGISQAEAARQLGLSTKHTNQMLTGRAILTLDWAERLLALCGKRLTIRVAAARRSPR